MSQDLTLMEIIGAVEAGNTVRLQFADRNSALNFRNNILSRAYKQRSQTREVMPVDFDSLSTSITEVGENFELEIKLQPKETIKFRCTVITPAGEQQDG